MKQKTFPLITKSFNNISYTILENGFIECDLNWNFSDIVSPFYRLYFFIEGEAYVYNEEQMCKLEPGNVYLIPANVRFNYRCPSKGKKFYIHFELLVLPELSMFEGLRTILSVPYDKMILEMIPIYATDMSLGGLLHLKALLLEYVANLFDTAIKQENFEINYRGNFKQKKVIEYINQHLSSSLKIGEIAESLNLSATVLARTFKRDMGITIKVYIESLILKKSKMMLLDYSKPIYEIAESLDFCDAYYFSRFFKKWEHCSPREYRKKIQ